jgi:hypothetical protein
MFADGLPVTICRNDHWGQVHLSYRAALGAGGFAEPPKHVDYLLGDECADGFIRSES